jgi:hypothetical protein
MLVNAVAFGQNMTGGLGVCTVCMRVEADIEKVYRTAFSNASYPISQSNRFIRGRIDVPGTRDIAHWQTEVCYKFEI